MAKFRAILEEHLEGINPEAMEQYPAALRDLIRGRSGVYALYRGEKLYYVGLASNMMGRLKHHVRDRHRGLWNRFSVFLTARPEQAHIRELEALLLRIMRPAGNRVGGRLRGARNLHPQLSAAMKRQDAERRARLIGVRSRSKPRAVKERPQRPRIVKRGRALKSRERSAANLTKARMALQRTYKDVTYTAVLRRDGQVRYAGALYPTLAAAAKDVVGRRVNGWSFWKAKLNGEWVRLSKFRED